MNEDIQDTPEIGVMPDFDPFVSSKMYDELKHLPEDKRELILPIVRALSINDQRAMYHFNFTKIHNASIRRMERAKKNWVSRATNALLWIVTTLIGAIALAWATKIIHP